MSSAERGQALQHRQLQQRPWHSPPHTAGECRQYLLTAACDEHRAHIGGSVARLSGFEVALIERLETCAATLHAHLVLPNHYHALVTVDVARGGDPIRLRRPWT